MKIKYYISIFIFLICLNCFSQNDKLPEIPEWMGNSCEDGIQFANRDVKLGKYKLINFGLILRVGDEWEFAKFYEDYLQENYNIETLYAGCSVYTTGECYDKEMHKILKTKHGDDFFEKTRGEIKKKFKKSMQLKIDTGFIFNIVDINPEFSGGGDSLFSFLERNVKYPSSCLNGSIKGKVYCQLIIEKNGEISSIKIARSPAECYSNEVIRVIKLSPNWKPGIYNNQAVKTKTIIPIYFN